MQAKITTEGRHAGHFFALGSVVELLDIPPNDAVPQDIFRAKGFLLGGDVPLTQVLNTVDFEIIPE